jgi:diguanylate cyclase (GGDEF)-like protein
LYVTKLATLARLAAGDNVSVATVLQACDLLASTIGADEAYVIKAGDPFFTRLGDDTPPESYEIKQRGYWLIWQELARNKETMIGSAVVKDRLVLEGGQPDSLPGFTHVCCLLPSDGSNSEIFIARGDWPRGLTEEEIEFLEAGRPVLADLVGRVLDSDRTARQREQLSAIARIAKSFSEARASDNVLASVATALAQASSFDWATVSIVDEDLSNVVDRAMNLARYSSTETAEMNMRRPTSPEFIRDLDEKREPRLYVDVMADERVTPDMRAYYQRAHILSTATFPLVFQKHLLGFVVFSSSTRHDFDAAEVAFLEDLVSQAATTVKGARLYQEMEQARQIQHFLARTDALTGVPNRRYFEEVLSAEFARARRYAEPLCVLMADMDHFKAINDSFGHQAGDDALRQIAAMAREACRESDFVGRWGGDEFVFILPMTDLEGAVAFAHRLSERIASTAIELPHGRTHRTTISMGAAEARAYGSAEALLQAADSALYRAKEGGRNRTETAPLLSGAAA